MKKIQLVALCGFFFFTIFNSAAAHDVVAARTALLVSNGVHSKASCARKAHKICEHIFNQCAKSSYSAIGGTTGYLVMYQCHSLVLSNGVDITTMVIAGSRSEDTNSKKLTGFVIRSHEHGAKLWY